MEEAVEDAISIFYKLKGRYEKDLQSNFFNPHKGSPPNSWSARLIERLGSSYKESAHLTMFERK